MSDPRKFLYAALVALVVTTVSRAQESPAANSSPKAEVTFDFTRTGLAVPKYTLNVMEDGAGVYVAQDNSSSTPQQVNRSFSITPSTTKKIFDYAHAIHPATCASKAKNIADTGTKVLTYITSTATSACIYNYSESKDIAALTDIFEGLAETLDLGRRLDFLHRFDRLGLDEAIESLAKEVSAGRAVELGMIEPSLRSVVADPQVMGRARTKASTLLDLIPANRATR